MNRISLELQNLALRLYAEGKQYTRSQIVNYLKEEKNINELTDSFRLNEIIRDVYNNIKGEEMRNAFLNSFYDHNGVSICQDAEIGYYPSVWNSGNNNHNIERIHQLSDGLNHQLILSSDFSPSELIAEIINSSEVCEANTSLSGMITGTNKIKEAKAEVETLSNKYYNLISEYDTIKDDVNYQLHYFDKIRTQLKCLREDVIQVLMEIFGDQLKSVEPELFNISQIDFVDTEKLIQKVQLEFDALIANSDKSISGITKDNIASFLTIGGAAICRISNNNTKEVRTDALVGAAIEGAFAIFESREQSQIETNKIRKRCFDLEKKLLIDKGIIEQDLYRIKELLLQLSESLIPILSKFTDQLNIQLQSTLIPYEKEILQDEELCKLKKENEKLIGDKRKQKLYLNDVKERVLVSNSILEGSKSICEELESIYHYAQDNNPDNIKKNSYPALYIDKIVDKFSRQHKRLFASIIREYDENKDVYNKEIITLKQLEEEKESINKELNSIESSIYINTIQIQEKMRNSVEDSFILSFKDLFRLLKSSRDILDTPVLEMFTSKEEVVYG